MRGVEEKEERGIWEKRGQKQYPGPRPPVSGTSQSEEKIHVLRPKNAFSCEMTDWVKWEAEEGKG